MKTEFRNATADVIMIDAFGTIALVAMMPAISIQIVGLMYKIKLSRSQIEAEEDIDVIVIENIAGEVPVSVVAGETVADQLADYDVEIIEFDLVGDVSLKS